MRTEINKKQGRPSECSEKAQVKGAKWGNNSWGRGGIGIFEVYDCQKCNFLAGNAGHSRQPPPQFYCINTWIGQFNTNKKIHTKLK